MKKCSQCQKPFTPARPLQSVCSVACAKRQLASAKRQERVKTLERKRDLETIPQLLKVAQREFNRYIRLRDFGKPCICCGQPLGDGAVGGGYDCGHYRSVGSASHLRFDERNAHAQRKQCNRWGAGRAVDYRLGLIARIGLAEVEALESDNRPRKRTRDELRDIADEYRKKAKALKNGNA